MREGDRERRERGSRVRERRERAGDRVWKR